MNKPSMSSFKERLRGTFGHIHSSISYLHRGPAVVSAPKLYMQEN